MPMPELAATAILVGYLGLGVIAKVLVPVGVRMEDGTLNSDPGDITNDELISIGVWVVATLVTAVVMVVLGTDPRDVILAGLIVVVGGGFAYAVLHYSVWGAHLLSIGTHVPWVGDVWGWVPWLVFPILLSSSLLVLTTRGVASLDTDAVVRILVTIGSVTLIAWIAGTVRSRRERTRRYSEWLRAVDAATSADPEVAEALRQAGWRPDGPKEEMAPIYGQTVAKVNRARALAGRPIFEGPVPRF